VFFFSVFSPAAAGSERYHGESTVESSSKTIKTPTDGGIRELIPDKYKDRFARWKTELLSTEFGRLQWDSYAANKHFILTFTMSEKKGQGAGTDAYLWDDSGNFVGATITLGNKIDKGFPDPIYYPVMNSLSASQKFVSIDGNILAATKIAHEIGHVNQTAKANLEILQRQNKLMPVYISIFLTNGRNPRDQNLISLADQMGGTPLKIWENREYWSEVNAMLYLRERIGRELFYCDVVSKIKNNIELYAKEYEDRFDVMLESKKSSCSR
jgi:hypothetical protein